MASRTFTNTLLLLVVLCLVVIVVKMYNVNPVAIAEAGGAGAHPRGNPAIVGCYMNDGSCEWRYIRVTDEGFLVTIK